MYAVGVVAGQRYKVENITNGDSHIAWMTGRFIQEQ